MKVSYFETGRYQAPPSMPAIWPMPAGAYDTGEGARVYQGMVERIELVEQLGFDWVSLSERDSFLGRVLAHFSLIVMPGAPGE